MHSMRCGEAGQCSAGQQACNGQEGKEDRWEFVQRRAELGDELCVPWVDEAHANVEDRTELDGILGAGLCEEIDDGEKGNCRSASPELCNGASLLVEVERGHQSRSEQQGKRIPTKDRLRCLDNKVAGHDTSPAELEDFGWEI